MSLPFDPAWFHPRNAQDAVVVLATPQAYPLRLGPVSSFAVGERTQLAVLLGERVLTELEPPTFFVDPLRRIFSEDRPLILTLREERCGVRAWVGILVPSALLRKMREGEIWAEDDRSDMAEDRSREMAPLPLFERFVPLDDRAHPEDMVKEAAALFTRILAPEL